MADPPYELPEHGPTAADLAAQDAFTARAKESLPAVRSTAEKWRNGLSALLTLVTTGILLTGPKTADDLTTTWRTALTVAVGAGLASAVYGLVQCLVVEAGAPTTIGFDDIRRRYGSFDAFDARLAIVATHHLQRGRRAGIAALCLLGVAAVASWWAPTTASPKDEPVVLVDIGDDRICGELRSADNGRLVVQVDGEERRRRLQLTEIDNIRVARACP